MGVPRYLTAREIPQQPYFIAVHRADLVRHLNTVEEGICACLRAFL